MTSGLLLIMPVSLSKGTALLLISEALNLSLSMAKLLKITSLMPSWPFKTACELALGCDVGEPIFVGFAIKMNLML
jgi:hypothetical protein